MPPPRHLPPQVDPQPLPVDPLDATILELSGWWLDIRCGCGIVTLYPLRGLCARLHPQTPKIGEVAAMFVCHECGARPKSIDLLERAGGNPRSPPYPQRMPIPLR